ncbi:MAG: class I SAM-dependent rRNA methyltransferase, partial [Phycisphaerae bacterium]
QRMVGEVDPAARAGDIVAVYDKAGRHFGHGFYHDRSQIALRMLSYDAAPIDDAFFRERLARAVGWRQRLFAGDGLTNVYRLVHAEGDGLSGLIAERYADWIAIEVFSLGVARRIDLFRRLLGELTGLRRFVVRADERICRLEGFRVPADASDGAPETVTVCENGVRFRVDIQAGHKTGFFCDQRENRRRLAALCGGASVLDVCCYTGGFGICAKKLGGAESVTGVDLDEKAIDLAKRNADLNQVRIDHVHADAFAYLRQMQQNGRAYDVVVLDPSKFVASREEYDEGARKYVDLNTLGMSVVKPGGLLLTCSCSGLVSAADFLSLVKAAANRLRRSLQIVEQTGAGPDHPVMANCPESAYLKAVWARLW